MTTTAAKSYLINLDDYVTLTVGGTNFDYRGLTGIIGGEEVNLDLLADNIEFLRCRAGEDDIRWLMLTGMDTIPHDRKWTTCMPVVLVDNITMAKEVAQAGINTDGFQGKADFVLINLLKPHQMAVFLMFDDESDAILHKMRS